MNIREIARLADVTPGTVSKVLNNYPDIGEATRQRVLKIIEENQYDPKSNQRAKSGTETIRVALVTEGVYLHIHSIYEDSLSIRLHNAGYSIVSFHDNYFAQDKTEKLLELIANAERDKVSGIIYIGGNFDRVDSAEFSKLPCPTVFINTVLPFHTDEAPYSSVTVSHMETAFDQMRCLIEKGHRDIATVISSWIDNSVYGLRANGYMAALRQSGLEHNIENFIESDYQSDKAYCNLLSFLNEHPEITAVCCQSDSVVQGVIRAIHDAGRIPGKDVDVISFDGLRTCEYMIPSITTFAQPAHDIVKCAFELLVGLINKDETHRHVTFRPSFRKRESC